MKFINAFLNMFAAGSLWNRIEIILLLMMIFSALYLVLIAPIVFNYFIIPKIEKKIGSKLEFINWYEFYLFGKFSFRFAEIVSYIIIKYIALKLKKDPHKIKINSKMALMKINYDIKEASSIEIVMSFLTIISGLLFFIIGGIIWYMHH